MSLAASTFAISDLAREFGITPHTIRFWEDQGISGCHWPRSRT